MTRDQPYGMELIRFNFFISDKIDADTDTKVKKKEITKEKPATS